MSLASDDDFELSSSGLEPVANGTSILLTGEDTDALEAVFYTLVAGRDDEHSVVLGTDCGGREVVRELNDAAPGAGDRARVLTCEGPDSGDNVTKISDLTDLTGLGMQFSTEIAEAQTAGGRFRAGILLCSSILGAVEDTRSVYRFLNSNFLNHFRRGDAIGVCAVDTSADFGAGTSSTVKGLETSFSARIDVVDSSRSEATVEVSGLGAQDGQYTVPL
jgi:hypothetical protein